MAKINHEDTTDAPPPVATVKTTYGYRRVIISDCPFCHKEHSHSATSNNGEKRMADCLLGEYILEIQ